jgi:signal transduction histidine kinase
LEAEVPVAGALQPVRLRELIDQVVASYAHAPEELAIEIPDDVRATADPEHLRRVVINLLDNAYKYGAPPVRVTAWVDGGQVTLVVSDAGDGVPEEFRPRLFEKFAQASSGSTRQSGSTGLGLSIVRGLAQAMHGEVGYEPAVPTGSQFIVRLPAVD